MKKILLLILVCIASLWEHPLFGQNENADIDLISVYEDYTEMDRELVYAHLNKTIYIKGESIGIKAYVLDKYSGRLATEAANLYCTISNKEGLLIERKMLMVESGTAVGDFEINDAYTSGYYTVKLYTNWMRNFNEDNLFVETIRIIDPNVEQQMVQNKNSDSIDAQFLPEGGHLLANVENVLGVIIKNEKGLGIPEIEGEIINEKGEVLTNFKVNQFGIGKCLLTPKSDGQYSAKFNHGDQEHVVTINTVETQGIAMRLSPLRDKVVVTIKTNTETLQKINKTFYKLVIHNGQEIKELTFKFNDLTEIVKVISNQDLFSGLNIFTVFDANNRPLLERMFFNYNDINMIKSGDPSFSRSNDTISITLPYKVEDNELINNISISVLPFNTNSFHHQNIASQFLLQNHLKSYVEQAHYYFSDITSKKQFELDNLLITQGWSSYDWASIFNNPPEYNFDYENGISYTINSADNANKQLMIFPTLNHPMRLVTLTKDNNSYTASGLFPIKGEDVKIREINANGKVTKPNLYVQFDPIKIPDIKSDIEPLIIDSANAQSMDVNLSIKTNLKNIQRLDEVIINKKKEYTKIEKLNNRSIGTVEEMDADMVRRYRTLDRYLRDKGFYVQSSANNNLGDFVILNNTVNSFRPRFIEDESLKQEGFAPEVGQEASSIPIVYLDDIILEQNLNLLQNMSLEDIEWIEVNKSGVGGGLRAGGAGLIKIKTRSTFRVDVDIDNVYASYDIPLQFNIPKKFYVPEYESYDSAFFNEFGVIDWLPNLTLNKQGLLEFKIVNNQVKQFKVFVEGIINNGSFVSEEKVILID